MNKPNDHPKNQSRISRINAKAKEYKPLIDIISIFTGLVLLFFTYKNVKISTDMLDLRLEQEENRQKPIWDFNITKDSIRLRSFLPEIKIQYGNIYLKSKSNNNDTIYINGPSYYFSDKKIINTIKRKDQYKTYNKPGIRKVERLDLEAGIEINYIQYGETKDFFGRYIIQYSIDNSKNIQKVVIDQILFDMIMESKDDLINYLDNLN